jgi:exopolysaccharide production protein ExoZ
MINRLDGHAPSFRNVQGLRAIAALLVFSVHLNVHELRFLYPLGEWGVDLFFVISGFVMITSTWNEFASPAISLRFFLRRLTRVYPPYWVAMIPIVLLFLFSPHAVNGSQAIRPSIPASLLLVPQDGKPLLTVSWTLVYEIFFYIIFAVVLAFDRRWCLPLVFAWGAATLVLGAALAPLHNHWADVYTSSISIEFIFGVCAGYLVRTRGALWPVASLVLGLVLIGAADRWYEAFDAAAGLHGSLRFLCIGVPAALIFNGAVGLETRYALIAPAALQRLGNASYSLYLWHVPLSILIERTTHGFLLRHPGPLVHALWLIAVVAIVISASLVLYDRVERPLLRLFGGWIKALEVRRLPNVPVPQRTPALTAESVQ